MKRLFKVMAICLVVVLLAGCQMKAEYGINITANKKVSVQIISAMDDDMIDTMIDMGDTSDGSANTSSKTHTDKERWAYLEKDANDDENYANYKKEKYEKGGLKGYTYSLELGDIDTLVGDGSKEVELNSMNEESKMFTKDGDVYTLKIKLSDDDEEQMSEYSSQVGFDVKLTVTLPNEAKTNNATEVNGTTYIWDLTKAKTVELSFEFTGKDINNNTNNNTNNNSNTNTIGEKKKADKANDKNDNTTLIIGIAAGVVVVGVIAFVALKKKKTA